MSRTRELADRLWQARQQGVTTALPEALTLAEAYQAAALNHNRRLAQGERAVGRKIGHTFAPGWPAQGISAPTWGWLYAGSTAPLQAELALNAWREPRVELELVLRLGPDGRPDAMALGLEVVDRPYPSWEGLGVPASVAAGGVHAALRLGPWQAFDAVRHGAALQDLRARLRVGSQRSEGGSERVLGSPLRALDALAALLAAQGALALQPGELISSGALAPALPMAAGWDGEAEVEGWASLRWVCT